MMRHALTITSILLVVSAAIIHVRAAPTSHRVRERSVSLTSRDVLGTPIRLPTTWRLQSADGYVLWQSPDRSSNLTAAWAPRRVSDVGTGLSAAAAELAGTFRDGRVNNVHASTSSGWFSVLGILPDGNTPIRVTQTWTLDPRSRRWRVLSWVDTPRHRLPRSVRLQGT